MPDSAPYVPNPPGAVLVTGPTRDEAEDIGPVAALVGSSAPEAHIPTTDDDSPDSPGGTGGPAGEPAGAGRHVRVPHRAGGESPGAARPAGFRRGLAHDLGVPVRGVPFERDAGGSRRRRRAGARAQRDEPTGRLRGAGPGFRPGSREPLRRPPPVADAMTPPA